MVSQVTGSAWQSLSPSSHSLFGIACHSGVVSNRNNHCVRNNRNNRYRKQNPCHSYNRNNRYNRNQAQVTVPTLFVKKHSIAERIASGESRSEFATIWRKES